MDWIDYMRKGEFELAWQFSDKILQAGLYRDYEKLPRHFQSIWDGSSLNHKRVLVRCYHGLGDTIQFVRYLPLLKEIASEVILWVQADLIELLKSVEGIDKIITLHDGEPETEYDVDVEIMELPFIFRTTLDTIPNKIPYFIVSPRLLPNRDNYMNVGLVWQAGNWNQGRNVPFSYLEPLNNIDKINLYILQANALQSGWEPGFGHLAGDYNLFEYASIIKGLDLLITVDSMPAHLAGALDIPVWLMLHKNCDWRWMENRSDSPWYPSMRLFRQDIEGDWSSVITNIVDALKFLLKNRN